MHTIESLRRAALEGLEPPSAAWRIDSEAEQRLVEALHIAGFAPLLKWNEEGYVLDIAIVLGKRRINIEVDGDQHKDAAGDLDDTTLRATECFEDSGGRSYGFPLGAASASPSKSSMRSQRVFCRSRGVHGQSTGSDRRPSELESRRRLAYRSRLRVCARNPSTLFTRLAGVRDGGRRGSRFVVGALGRDRPFDAARL